MMLEGPFPPRLCFDPLLGVFFAWDFSVSRERPVGLLGLLNACHNKRL